MLGSIEKLILIVFFKSTNSFRGTLSSKGTIWNSEALLQRNHAFIKTVVCIAMYSIVPVPQLRDTLITDKFEWMNTGLEKENSEEFDPRIPSEENSVPKEQSEALLQRNHTLVHPSDRTSSNVVDKSSIFSIIGDCRLHCCVQYCTLLNESRLNEYSTWKGKQQIIWFVFLQAFLSLLGPRTLFLHAPCGCCRPQFKSRRLTCIWV